MISFDSPVPFQIAGGGGGATGSSRRWFRKVAPEMDMGCFYLIQPEQATNVNAYYKSNLVKPVRSTTGQWQSVSYALYSTLMDFVRGCGGCCCPFARS